MTGGIPAQRFVVRAGDLVVALLCLLPALYLSNRLPTLHTVTDGKYLVVLCLSGAVVFLAALAWAVRPARASLGRQAPIEQISLLIGAGAFAVAHGISAAFSQAPGHAFRSALPSLALIALFGAMVCTAPPARKVRKFAALLVVGGVLVGLIATAQHLGHDPLASWVRYREADRFRTGVYATLGNPEYLGGYLAPLVLAALGLAFGGWHPAARGALLGAAGLMTLPVLWSGSRGAFLGLVAGALAFLVAMVAMAPHLSRRARGASPEHTDGHGPTRTSRRVRLAVLAAMVAAVVVLCVAVLHAPEGGPFALLRGRLVAAADPHNDSIRNRIVFNLVGLEMVARRPVVGVGPGMYAGEFYPAFRELARRDPGVAMEVLARDFSDRAAEHAHNDWLEIWAETGTLGLAAWLWLLVAWAGSVVRALSSRATAFGGRALLVGLSAGVVALAVNASFNFPLHEPARATVFYLLLALSASQRK